MATKGYQFEFLWDIKFIIKTKESEIVVQPTKILSITKNCNYYEDFLPKIALEVNIDEQYLYLFHNYKANIIVNIRLTKLYLSPNVAPTQDTDVENGISNIIKTEIVSENNYIALFEKPLPAMVLAGSSYMKEDGKTPQEGKPEDGENLIKYNLIKISCTLFEIDDRRINKFTINDHIISATVGDGLGTLLTLLSQKDKRQMKVGQIIDKPDNMVKYKEIWLLPGNLYRSIKSIQRIYGIYNRGVVIFLDHGLLYILKKNVSKHEYADFQSPYTSIALKQRPGTLNYPPIVYIDDAKENSASYQGAGQLNIMNTDVETSETIGDYLVYTNNDLISSLVNVEGGEMSLKEGGGTNAVVKPTTGFPGTGTKAVLDYDELNNPYNMTEYFDTLSPGIVIPIVVNGCDPTDFSPNKEIILNIDDDKEKDALFNGSYCIRSATFTFLPRAGLQDGVTTTTCTANIIISKSKI